MALWCHTTRRDAKGGFTIVELLVASSIALVVMGALTSLFAMFGRSVSDSQSVVDMNNRMRLAANRLRMDLAGVTAPLTPPLDGESGAGYFEIVEGPQTDDNSAVPANLLADTDDAMVFTTRSSTQPFSGKFGSARMECDYAEVAWFCLPSSYQPVAGLQLQTLYRRNLLVVGYVGSSPFTTSNANVLTGQSLPGAYSLYDISLRATGASTVAPNKLTDLMQRPYRFFHGPDIGNAFPTSTAGLAFDANSGREGEDVVLTNVIAFDVRVFDPDAVARQSGTVTLLPGDPGYAAGSPGQTYGCFIDLGQDTVVPATTLSSPMAARSRISAATGTATYDTWTTHYEYNGKDDDNDGSIDEGTDGIDNDGNGLVDESAEAETSPPYAVPLKAIEIRIRCYDPTSKQVRQITIRHAFNN